MGNTKKFIIVVLLIVAGFLFFVNRAENFTPITKSEYESMIQKQLEKWNAKLINDTYNYNPIPLQCPEGATIEDTWDANTKVCKKDNEIVKRECPKDMIREGDYCYLPCREGYERKHGLCWKKE